MFKVRDDGTHRRKLKLRLKMIKKDLLLKILSSSPCRKLLELKFVLFYSYNIFTIIFIKLLLGITNWYYIIGNFIFETGTRKKSKTSAMIFRNYSETTTKNSVVLVAKKQCKTLFKDHVVRLKIISLYIYKDSRLKILVRNESRDH